MRDEPEVLREAREELEEALAWYRERNPRAAAGLLAEVIVALAHQKREPGYWRFR